MKIAVVLGTRPEIIKMSPVIKELENHRRDYFIIHAGQHFSYSMDSVFFKQLNLPAARYNLEAGPGSHAQQTARILTGVERVLDLERPDILLAEGDTNTVLAAALAAAKLNIRVGHIEAGLRSYDRKMPEEINRILTDHCSDYLFAPTRKAAGILKDEGIPGNKIFITGNTIVDAVHDFLKTAVNTGDTLKTLGIKPGGYFLATVHRQENVDNPERFDSIIRGLDFLSSYYELPVIYPVHPRSGKRLSEYKLDTRKLRLIEPLDYFSFLQVEKNSRLTLTDSGGVQEESCILGVPCVTLRDNTERPETLEVGANILAGTSAEKILECSEIMLKKRNGWQNPFGDGNAARTIISIITGGTYG